MDKILKSFLVIITELRLKIMERNLSAIKIEIIANIEALQKKYPEDIIYCLVTAIDEAALSNSDIRDEWLHDTLLKKYFNDNWGGEKIYTLLEKKIHEEITLEIKLLFYYILSLGYEGKCKITGKEFHASLRKEIYVQLKLKNLNYPEKIIKLENNRYKKLTIASLISFISIYSFGNVYEETQARKFLKKLDSITYNSINIGEKSA